MSQEKEKVEYTEDSVQNVVNNLFDEVSSIKDQLKESKSSLDENKIADIVRNVNNERDSQAALVAEQDRSYNSVVETVKNAYKEAGIDFDSADETQIINNYASFANLESNSAEREKRNFNFKNVEQLTVDTIKKSIEKFSKKESKSSKEDAKDTKKVETKKTGKMSLASEGEDMGVEEELDDIQKEISELDKLAETNKERAEGRRMVLLANLQILKQKMLKEKAKRQSFF